MSALLCHVLGVSSVDGEGRCVGVVVSCVGSVKCRGGGGGRRGRRTIWAWTIWLR